MTPEIFIKRHCRADTVKREHVIQPLWSGYGEVVRYSLTGKEAPTSVIIKHCSFPKAVNHPRGWHSDLAHQRKVRSYDIEQYWYRKWAPKCPPSARVACCYGDSYNEDTGQRLTLLEDLDASGYSARYEEGNIDQLIACIHWLASFHARFLHESPAINWPQGLWLKGTYWHLDTRPDEWSAMANGRLKSAAAALAKCLDQARFKTIVHGDAKVANFCFSPFHQQVAAVDFQYVGGGVGVQDLAYLLGGALSEQALADNMDYLLAQYFSELGRELMAQGESQAFVHDVLDEWQALFMIAWADFHRFIIGWSPSHTKNTEFSQKLTEQALDQLYGQ
ncbi:ecdysteroid 22-kinase family protein [Marinomonas algarum]|uniref:Ecdysteroid 22-kinase family protein n=1 Tax=Marinomonas algarum TaxID=2883105 RepID=A0A9X1ILI6_9GAMM|nr:ecdysteroid 22-kinase family protein [Marinomonas algarum]MCB5161435.1 ecdysteroid 22-kinase family protein [Marinomonas algarum]